MSLFRNPFFAESDIFSTGSTALTGLEAAQMTDAFALDTLGSELAGLNALQEMNSAYSAFGNALDLENLDRRFRAGNQLRGMENSVFDAMTQEKLENLDFEMNFFQAQNRFNLAKTIVNAAKYGG